mmetsp:Transcript_98912/g.248045  ORF Transcript_98912/g.248045 Transcript_98912/m.248045 type:complete len:205 (+) Transcript_98912:160-774(+)
MPWFPNQLASGMPKTNFDCWLSVSRKKQKTSMCACRVSCDRTVVPVWLSTGNARPRTPSKKRFSSCSVGPARTKLCSSMTQPPMERRSAKIGPMTAPTLYWILTSSLQPSPLGQNSVDDFFGLNLEPGTQRSEEPVSKMTVITCPGVPSSTVPKYCTLPMFCRGSTMTPVPADEKVSGRSSSGSMVLSVPLGTMSARARVRVTS